MRRILLLGLVFFMFGLSAAQSVRSLGMGGLLLPGPDAADLNPAYAAYPANRYGDGAGFTLPLGLVNLTLRPSVSPFYYFKDRKIFKDNFDALAFYDQLIHFNEFIINPPSSPEEIVFHVSADGLTITDGAGKPLRLNRFFPQTAPSASLPAPLFQFHIPSGIPGLRIALGGFLQSAGFGLTPDDQLVSDLASGNLKPNTLYTLHATGSLRGGATASIGFSTPLPSIPGFNGHIYTGGQIRSFYGLLYADTIVTAQTTTDSSGAPGPVKYSSNSFYVYPGKGQGWGTQLDLGIALDYDKGSYGLGISNLVGVQRWYGRRLVTDTSGNIVTDEPATIMKSGFHPGIFMNAAYLQPTNGGELLLGADIRLGVGGSWASGHVGAEYRLAITRLRAGMGYDNGLKVGLGAGLVFPGFHADLALTSHSAPYTSQIVFGLAASLGVSF